MATQVATSITALTTGQSGHMAVSLSGLYTTSVLSILAGSSVEVADALFTFTTDETPSGWSAIATANSAWVALAPSGSAGSQILSPGYVAGIPVWVASKAGWYTSTGSNIRVVAFVYKGGATSYQRKGLLIADAQAGQIAVGSPSAIRNFHIKNQEGGGTTLRIEDMTTYFDIDVPTSHDRMNILTPTDVTALSVMSDATVTMGYGVKTDNVVLKTKIVNIGEWNMQSTAIVTVAHGISSAVTRIVACNVLIRNDAGALSYPIDRWLVGQNSWGNYTIDATDITLTRIASGGFDATNYDATAGTVANRGFITLVYQV